MKSFVAIFFTLLLITPGYAQKPIVKKYVDKADDYFEAEDYVNAAALYEEAIKLDTNYLKSFYKAAESYRKLYNYSKAEQYYKKVVKDNKDPKVYPVAMYYYARMQKAQGKYEEAKVDFEKFLGSYDPRVVPKKYKQLTEHYYLGCLMAINEKRNGFKDFAFKNEGKPLSTKFDDNLPTIFENENSLIISSLRTSVEDEKQALNLEKDNYDQYRYVLENGKWKQNKSNRDRFDVMNSESNEIPGTFNGDKTKYYFTRCNIQNEEANSVDCAIYVSKKKKDKWQDPKLLNELVNARGSWNGAPEINAKGNKMYFVSNRKGGYGSYDIWYTTLPDVATEDWK
ncbi:MAG: tetratricopeptide repeat protein, partial [Cyclobacteriaceae bacterium]